MFSYPIEWTVELRFLVAVALGFLVGLERERYRALSRQTLFAGVRTYTIISMYGYGCAWLFRSHVDYALPLGMLTLAGFAVTGYITKLKEGRVGWTSEISAALTFVVGSLCLLTDIWIPMALGIVNTFLLSEKAELEKLVEKLDKAEYLAVVKFLLVTLIILPALPNREFTPFNINPARVWQIVILVSSLGFIGYIFSKLFGNKVGLWLSGILGGIVSSTAVSVSMGRLAQRDPKRAPEALRAALLACSVMYLRILVLLGILNPLLLAVLWWKLVALFLIGVASAFTFRRTGPPAALSEGTVLQNPFEIRPALLFAAAFVLLSVATVFVRNLYGSGGLLVVAALVGVTDIDPFILSLVHGSVAEFNLIARAIIIAMMSNTILKGVYVSLPGRAIRSAAIFRYGAWALLHVPLLFI
jgi:uncharacterized membrane protein (DUF4010 family)